MFQKFFKCEYRAGSVLNRSVLHVSGGRMLGGNSAFAHVGSYQELDGIISGRIIGQRHAVHPSVSQLYGADDDELIFRAWPVGNTYHLEASPVRLPEAAMQAVMTPLDEDALPPPGHVGSGGITNGLYAVRTRVLDGLHGELTGVMLLQDGRMLGGDAFFYYLGSYSSENGRWKGEIVNQEHTSARNVIFGGHEVGIGFSGQCDGDAVTWEATALAGKRSLQLASELKLLHRI